MPRIDVVPGMTDRVQADRLWQDLMALAQFGKRADGGVDRQALSDEDRQARQFLTGLADRLDLQTSIDPIGNMFFRMEGADAQLAPVMIGSHIDSQPSGGKFDGAYGVMAAFEAIRAVRESSCVPARPIEIVAWCNEEGSRFAPGAMGSSVFAGAMRLEDALRSTDRAGCTVAEEMAKTEQTLGHVARRAFSGQVHAYVEPHIEQGPILESAHCVIGVVTGIQAVRWLEVNIRGNEAHAGTTPMTARRDALVEAVRIISAIQFFAASIGEPLRLTVGRLEVEPNSPNTIPGNVFFSLDIRHPDEHSVKQTEHEVRRLCCVQDNAFKIAVKPVLQLQPTCFDPRIGALIKQACEHHELTNMEIVSGAFHDAKFLATVCPSAMIFVPCAGGVSHNPLESAQPDDLANGAKILTQVSWVLANS